MKNFEKITNNEKRERQEFEDIEMKVELTNICNSGRCKFCSPLFRPVVEETDTESFLSSFAEHVETYMKQGGKKIILTGGGEPTDAPDKLFGALKIIKRAKEKLGIDLDLLTIYSNGVKLLSPISEKDTQIFLDKLAEYGVKDINLSISGSSREEITEISGEKMGEIDYDTLIPAIREKGIRVMTRTTLAKGYVDSLDDILEFTDKMSRLGVSIIYFSDLFKVPIRDKQTTPGSQKILKWTDDHRVDFLNILNSVKQSADFEFISQSGRHNDQGQTFEFRYKKNGARILLGNLVIGNEPDDEATYCYVKPDGSMDTHNNAREKTSRKYISIEEAKKYRPERDDI